MAPEISMSTSAKDLGDEINERYSRTSASLLYKLKMEAMRVVQGGMTVTKYLNKLRNIWDEIQCLNVLNGIPECSCGNLAKCACKILERIQELEEQDKLLHFLINLNPEYNITKKKILSTIPMPSLNNAYQLVLKVEKQRQLSAHNTGTGDPIAFMASSQDTGSSGAGASFSGAESQSRKDRRRAANDKKCCSFCSLRGHLAEACIELIGYNWSKGKKGKRGGKLAAGAMTDDTPIHGSESSISGKQGSLDFLNSFYPEAYKTIKGGNGQAFSAGTEPRKRNSMISYWKYLEPQLTSSCTQDSKILIVGAQQCEDMVEKIYSLEYKHITCTDSKKEVIADMMKKHLVDRKQTEIKWRVLDSTQKLVPSKSKDTFDVVIDNGTLPALTSQDEIKSYIYQLWNILTTRKGGKFICFMDCSTTTTNTQLLVNTFLAEFRYTFKLFFQILEESQVAMFVMERAITFTIYLIQHNTENVQMLNEIINEENSKRLKMLEKSKLSLEDIISGAMDDPNIILQGRKFWIQHKVKENRYKILVMDFGHLPSFIYSWMAFYSSKADSSFFTTEMVVDAIARHSQASRVYVVLLGDKQDSFDMNHLDKTELGHIFGKLAPEKCTTGFFWSRKISGDEVVNLEKEDVCELKYGEEFKDSFYRYEADEQDGFDEEELFCSLY